MLQTPEPVGPVPPSPDAVPRKDEQSCPHCLTAHQAGARFCPICGAPVTTPAIPPEAVRVAPAETPSAASSVASPTPAPGLVGKVDGRNAADSLAPSAQPPSQPLSTACACGYAQPPGAQYCPQCGRQVEGKGQPSHRLTGRSTAGKQYSVPLAGPECSIGKNADCSVAVPEDDYMSRRHAKITVKGDQILLEDLGSANGTFLRIRRPVVLQPGDEILVGTSLFRLESQRS